MRKCKYLTAILSSTALMVLYPLMGLSFAEQNQERHIAINNELNCIESHFNTKDEVTWQDLCYASGSSRDSAVTKALDSFEKPSHKLNQKHKLVKKKALVNSKRPSPREDHDLGERALNNSSNELSRLVDMDFQLLGGHRSDNLKFNIAGNPDGTDPNILSELTWSDIRMRQIKGVGTVILLDHFIIEGKGSYANTLSGDNQDSDYLGDDRTLEFSRSNNQADEGEAFDWSVGLGYKLSIDSEKGIFPELDSWSLTALAGYSYHEQHLVMTDGFQTLDPYNLIGFTGPFSGLQSKYDTQWDGPWVGLKLDGAIKKFSGFLRFEYHFASYSAEADWNLRSDFQHPKSYEHVADGGSGLIFGAGVGYQLTDRWNINFNADWQSWRVDEGVDRTFLSSGAIATTQLNEVQWNSYALMLGMSCHFP